jgi:hypothetical protein
MSTPETDRPRLQAIEGTVTPENEFRKFVRRHTQPSFDPYGPTTVLRAGEYYMNGRLPIVLPGNEGSRYFHYIEFISESTQAEQVFTIIFKPEFSDTDSYVIDYFNKPADGFVNEFDEALDPLEVESVISQLQTAEASGLLVERTYG